MPKVPIDYTKTIIYKLVHKDDLYDENIYTGHTTNYIKRKCNHKYYCTNPNNASYNTKKYKYIRENGGWDEWLMIEIEKYPCKDVNEALARERVVQNEMKAKLNSDIAGRTKKEWEIDNRDKVLENKKQYYQANKEIILEKVNNYVKNNREKISEKRKQRYEDNHEKILEQLKQKITCDHCGCLSTKGHMARHQKTKKCINFKPA